MSPTADNKKRKYEDTTPSELNDNNSVLSNFPALPPPPAATPPSSAPNAPPNATQATSKARPKRARGKNDKKDEAERQSRFHCDFCNRDLSHSIRARCAVCPDYDSCLDCFSVGAALKPHKPEHAYRLIQVVHTPIFQVGWSADEEEKMLEGLELYGVGNWEQVAKLIESKNPLETEQHYMRAYLQSSTAPLPDPSKSVPVEKVPVSEKYDDVDPKALRVMHMHQQEDAAGWMEKRQDFVYEWDNEAEEIIGDMEVTEDDTKADKDLRSQVLEIYAHKLSEREKRKQFVLERGLTDFKGYQAAEKKRPKEERELRDKLRVFMRFLPQQEMDKFIKSLLEERQIRARIDMLREGRNQGAKTIEECERISAKNKMRSLVPPSEASALSGSGTTSVRRPRRSNGEKSTSEVTPGPSNGHSAFPASVDSKDRKGSILGDVDLEMMPGAELLSSTEISLCSGLKMTPHQYLIVKDVMIRESIVYGGLKKKDAKAKVRLDPIKVSKIYEYLLACGWIRIPSSSVVANRTANNPTAQNGSKAQTN